MPFSGVDFITMFVPLEAFLPRDCAFIYHLYFLAFLPHEMILPFVKDK